MWTTYEAESANQLWDCALSGLLSSADELHHGSRAGATREILHVALALGNPRDRWITHRQPPLNIPFALAEVIWILSGRSDARFLSYFNRSLKYFAGDAPSQHGAYGARLRTGFGIDQLDRGYRALSSNPDSRQIVLQIWDPNRDLPYDDGLPRNADIPCNTQSIIKVRNNKLEWLQIMRSNDAFLGLPYNIIQFTFLQEVFAGWLNLDLGNYHHVSDSLHLYCRDFPVVSTTPISEKFPLQNFSLSKESSDRAITKIADCVDLITNRKVSSSELIKSVDQSNLTQPYEDILRVLAAEGLRKRGKATASTDLMEGCQNPTFNHMWVAWKNRFSESK
jgi:thymidylate synthase